MNGMKWVMVFLMGSLLSCQPKVLVKQSVTGVDVHVLATEGEDSEYTEMIQPYKQQLDASMNNEIGTNAIAMTAQRVECNLGNFMADLMQIEGSKVYGQPVDMGVVTNGSLRKPIAAGAITTRDIYELMPFENRLNILELTGAQVMEMAAYLVRTERASISNTKIHAVNGEITSITVGGEPLDLNKKYSLSVSDYLAGGGDQMKFLLESKTLLAADYMVRQMIFDYIQAHTDQGLPIKAEIEGRVIIE